jgi:hypothetical protein
MTVCVVHEGKVINVGPWDEEPVEVVDRECDGVPADAVVRDGFWLQHPMPEGAATVDVDLAWTEAGQIVLATDPQAVRPAVF